MRLFFWRPCQPGGQHGVVTEAFPDHGGRIGQRGPIGAVDRELRWLSFGEAAHTDAEQPNALSGERYLFEQLSGQGPDLRGVRNELPTGR